VNENITITKTISIREAGFDEFWLQDQICKNPAALKLGGLEVMYKERIQTSGRRLDILLKDPEDDSMFEVEVMLGETDETHIIRTIDYWDKEQRKYPQRQHFAVLVSERIDSDFFNIIYRFSHSIPIIAIQVNLLEVEGKRALHFSKVIDTYEEPEDLPDARQREASEATWHNAAPQTLEAAKILLEITKPKIPDAKLHFTQSYIVIEANRAHYIWLKKRGGGASYLSFWFTQKNIPEAEEQLKKTSLSFEKKSYSKGYNVCFTTDGKALQTNSEVMVRLAELARLSYEE
jgi:hypothetical protein